MDVRVVVGGVGVVGVVHGEGGAAHVARDKHKVVGVLHRHVGQNCVEQQSIDEARLAGKRRGKAIAKMREQSSHDMGWRTEIA